MNDIKVWLGYFIYFAIRSKYTPKKQKPAWYANYKTTILKCYHITPEMGGLGYGQGSQGIHNRDFNFPFSRRMGILYIGDSVCFKVKM